MIAVGAAALAAKAATANDADRFRDRRRSGGDRLVASPQSAGGNVTGASFLASNGAKTTRTAARDGAATSQQLPR